MFSRGETAGQVVSAPQWHAGERGEWHCTWRGHRLEVREVVTFHGFIDGEHVTQHGSLEKARARLVVEVERNGNKA